MPRAVDVSVVIVAWNCADLLERCLRSVYASRGTASFEVIVVDNASRDRTVSMVRERYPAARLIEHTANVGFARGNNAGFRVAAGRYLFMLNPDAELLEADTLDRLVAFMDANPAVGAAGCMLRDVDGGWQNSAGYHPGPLTILSHNLFLPHLTGNAVRGLCLMRPDAAARESIDVDWVSGASMVVRREVLEDAGWLDESYFMYGEDIEWARRMAGAGWRVVHLPGVRVRHVFAGTRADKDRVPVAWLDGLARVYMETDPRRSWLFFKACFGGGFVLRAALALARSLVARDEWAARRTVEAIAQLKHLHRMRSPLAEVRDVR